LAKASKSSTREVTCPTARVARAGSAQKGVSRTMDPPGRRET
jgi:hypothetical protein